MSLEYFHSQRNGQLVLENQSVATTDTKNRKHPKSDMLSQVCDCTCPVVSTPWLISGCEAGYKAVVLLQWQVPKGLRVI